MLKYARLALAIVSTLTACFGQITTTGIHGIVRDPSGAIVPGAAIKILDPATACLSAQFVYLREQWKFNFQAEALNFLSHPFFPLANTGPTATNLGQITSAVGTRTMLLRGSLEW